MSLLSILKNKLRSLVPVSRTYMDNKLKAVSYTHLDVYKRQPMWRQILTTPENMWKGNCQG